MAAFQPIEDAGPRLAFRVIHFLRIFVTTASPGVVAGTPLRDQDGPWILLACSSELRGRMERWFSGISSEDKLVLGNV